MKAWKVESPALIENSPLRIVDEIPTEPGEGEITLQVNYCGICRTDLHIVEGDIESADYPVIPGHQIVGEVKKLGPGVTGISEGEVRGAYWLHRACGECHYCRAGRENLCQNSQFTGLDVPGGFAEEVVVDVDYTVPVSTEIELENTAPLLCAGIIGYRSLRLSDIRPGGQLALFGFGSCAHIVMQVAHHWDCDVVVYTRSESHQNMARNMGALWVGKPGEQAPMLCDSAISFAPAGELVPMTLRSVRPGGTVALNAIAMTDIPQFSYQLLYGERTLRSVANVTRRDAEEFFELVPEIPVQTEVRTYAFEQLEVALKDVKNSRVNGSAVLKVDA